MDYATSPPEPRGRSPTHRSSSPPGGRLQSAVTSSGNAAWNFYRGRLAGPAATVAGTFIPQATRDALFQLFCDLRANVPKDARFLRRHAKALKPQTLLGWVALAGVLGYVSAALLLLATLSLTMSVAGMWAGMAMLLCMAVVLAVSMSCLAIVLAASACAAGAMGLTALSFYLVGWVSLEVMRFIMGTIFGTQDAAKKTLMPAFPSEKLALSPGGGAAAGEKEEEAVERATAIPAATHLTPRGGLPTIRVTTPKKGSPTKESSPPPPSLRSSYAAAADSTATAVSSATAGHTAGSPAEVVSGGSGTGRAAIVNHLASISASS